MNLYVTSSLHQNLLHSAVSRPSGLAALVRACLTVEKVRAVLHFFGILSDTCAESNLVKKSRF